MTILESGVYFPMNFEFVVTSVMCLFMMDPV